MVHTLGLLVNEVETHTPTQNMAYTVNYLDDGGVKEALADFESFAAEVLVVAIRKLIMDSRHGIHQAVEAMVTLAVEHCSAHLY